MASCAACRASMPHLIAYKIPGQPDMAILNGPQSRAWMDLGARRCLPLVMANQAGWLLLNRSTFTATWSGGADGAAIELDGQPFGVVSHFGGGILTFSLPYLLRTDPGWNVLFRGPANHVKDGIQPLEGLVETDWNPATATMNWRFTRPGAVLFEADEPFCQIVPQRRGQLESFVPTVQPLANDPELARQYQAWTDSRARFLVESQQPGTDEFKEGWQRHYMRGRTIGGRHAGDHQTKLALRGFVDA